MNIISKTFFIICILILLMINGLSQTKNFHIIYIDNSMSVREDVLNEAMYDKISQIFDKIQTENASFILFASDGLNYTITYNPLILPTLIDKIFSKHSKMPDQFFDVDKMRDIVYEKLSKYQGNVNFDFFVIGETAGNIYGKACPLFKFFPIEIAYVFNKKVNVKINCPLATLTNKTEDIKAALDFYKTEYHHENIAFNIITF